MNFQMTTRGKTLVPHVLASPSARRCSFPTTIRSRTTSSPSPRTTFDLGLYRRGAGKSHKFDTPGVVNVYCNVHPNMSSVIHVMASPYFAFADAKRQLRAARHPAGKYRSSPGTSRVGQNAVEGRHPRRGPATSRITLDSRNYRASSTWTKTGKPYAPPRDY
jgi:hypothetical protein